MKKFKPLLYLLVATSCADPLPASADSATCFSFQSPVTKILAETPEAIDLKAAQAKEDKTASGTLGDELKWGAARGQVDHSAREILTAFLNPYTMKDPTTTQVNFTDQSKSGVWTLRTQHVNLSILGGLFHPEWDETWSYLISVGDVQKPLQVVIAYEKTAGTSQLEKLCGSIWVRELNPHQSNLYLFEEVKTSHRTAEDIALGHLGTLKTLRAIKTTIYEKSR